MKVNCIDKNSVSFNGFYNSKALKSFLSFAENNGALFASATALTLSAIRPVAIMLTPRTDKENKKIACAKAVMSTILDFGVTLAVSIPIVKAVGNINKNPEKYLKNATIENLKNGAESLDGSKAYTLANQMFKLGIGFAIALPKALLNLIGLPYTANLLFNEHKSTSDKSEDLTFKGKGVDKLSSIIGKTMDTKFIQTFSKNNAESNFPMHVNAAKDILSTGVFALGLNKSKKIDEERKKPLIFNSLIGTGLSIASGYILDSALNKPAEKFIKKLKAANINDPNLKKYIDGFWIAKPVMILGITYYVIIPMISTFFGERIGNNGHAN